MLVATLENRHGQFFLKERVFFFTAILSTPLGNFGNWGGGTSGLSSANIELFLGHGLDAGFGKLVWEKKQHPQFSKVATSIVKTAILHPGGHYPSPPAVITHPLPSPVVPLILVNTCPAILVNTCRLCPPRRPYPHPTVPSSDTPYPLGGLKHLNSLPARLGSRQLYLVRK